MHDSEFRCNKNVERVTRLSILHFQLRCTWEKPVENDNFRALSLPSITIIPIHFHTVIVADKYFSTLRSSDFSNQNCNIAFRR